ERLGRIDGRARAIVDLRLLSPEKIAERLQPILHLAIDRNLGRVEHQRHLEIAQALLAWRRELELPSRGLDRVRSRHDGQREREVVGASGQRSDDVDVDRRVLPWQRLPVTRHDAPRGLASVYAGTPHVVGSPATSYDSLIVIGTPCSGPRAPRARSSAFARVRARSKSRTTIAFSAPSYFSTRAR